MRRSMSLSVALAAVIAVGCESEPIGSVTSADPGNPVLAAAQANSGAVVVRLQTQGAFGLIDFDRQVFALHSSDDSRGGCQTVTEVRTGEVQLVFTPSGAVHQLTQGEESFVTVYDLSGGPTIDCDFLNGATGRMIAEGAAAFVWRDNDLFVTGSGAHVYGVHSSGRLNNLLDGGLLGYHANFRWQTTPSGSSGALVRDIKLTPDPR